VLSVGATLVMSSPTLRMGGLEPMSSSKRCWWCSFTVSWSSRSRRAFSMIQAISEGGGAYGEVEVCSAADAFEGFIEVVDVEEEDYLGAGALSGYE